MKPAFLLKAVEQFQFESPCQMILILSDSFDTHADEVERHLSNVGARYFRLNLDVDALSNAILTFRKGMWVVSQGGKTITSVQTTCVWARRLTVNLTLEDEEREHNSDFKLWRGEWNRSLFGFYSYLRNCFWMNPIQPASLFDNKPYQFMLAERHGFNVPEYVISNQKEQLVAFASEMNYVALKFMSQDIYRMPDGSVAGLYVNRISSDELGQFGATGENPITLQKYVEKKFEVRHTYVDGYHFSCRIDSQDSSIANTDWRRYDVARTPHSQIEAPDGVLNKIQAFMEQAALAFGAFDFIVDSDDRWWYLEVNTAGQWLWIEDLAGLPISATIAEVLNGRAEGRQVR